MKSKLSALVVDPGKCVGVDDVHLGREERLLIQRRQHWVGGEQARHLRIEIDQRDALDLRILQDLAHGQTVAAAENQHAAWRGNGRQARDGSALRDSGIRRAN